MCQIYASTYMTEMIKKNCQKAYCLMYKMSDVEKSINVLYVNL